MPLVHLHGAGGMRLTRGHDLLSRHYQVIAFEMPGFGQSPENTRTETINDLAATMGAAVSALGIDKFNLMGTSFGGKVALWLAVQQQARVQALVLEAPAAIRPAGTDHRGAHPRKWRAGSTPIPNASARCRPRIRRSRRRPRALVGRLRGPDRDAELEKRCAALRRRRWCCSAHSIA